MQEMTLGVAGTRPDRAAQPSTWAALLRNLLFRAAVLANEAALVLVGGDIVGVLFGKDVGLPAPSVLAVAYAVIAVAVGAYAQPPWHSRRAAAFRVLVAISAMALLFATRPLAALPPLATWLVLSFAAVAVWRRWAMHLARSVTSLRPPRRPVAFIGDSEGAVRMLRQIQADPDPVLRPVGYFDDRHSRPGPLQGLLPCLGNVDDLVRYIHENELHDVYMALPWSAGERISVLIERLRFLPLTVRLIPDHVPPALRGGDASRFEGVVQLQGVVLPTLMLPPFSTAGAAAKRALDLCFSVLLLVPLLPLFLIISLIIRLDSRGPAFFRQIRSGQYGRSFEIYKFRTLHVAQADAAAETLVGAGDRRVTRVGRILRKYSIDELPQIINVAIGDMSLVGPRPHAPRAKADGRIYAEVIPDYMLRYRVKPGMTGWAQVNGWRGNTDTEEKLRRRVEFDFDYIRNWSFLRDLEILMRTVPSVLAPPPDNA